MENIISQSNEIVLEQNILQFQGSFIQINNVTRIFVQKAKKRISLDTLVAPLIFLLMFVFGGLVSNQLSQFGLLGLCVAVVCIIIYMLEKKYYLIVSLNSGEQLHFYSKEVNFLIEALEVLLNAIKSNKAVKIDFENCIISDSQIGGENVMTSNLNFENVNNTGIINTGKFKADIVNTGNQILGKGNIEDWDTLLSFFEDRLQAVKDPEIKFLIKQAVNYTEKKDKNGLKGFIENNISNFKDNIFNNIATAGIIDLLKKLLGITLF